MKLRYITCSDPRENISVPSLINFTEKYPISELGIQAHPGPMSYKGRRYGWFNQIMFVSGNMPTPPNIALHINYEWCDCMCRGIIPIELQKWINARNDITKEPVIKRIQLNIGDNTRSFNPLALANLIKNHKDQEFILPYNKNTSAQIAQLKSTGVRFSLLFDNSYGTGISPDEWQKPVYEDVPNGYAGGLGPGNVEIQLKKINKILPADYETWIDAEGRLRDIYDTQNFSLGLAERYMSEAIKWHNQNTK